MKKIVVQDIKFASDCDTTGNIAYYFGGTAFAELSGIYKDLISSIPDELINERVNNAKHNNQATGYTDKFGEPIYKADFINAAKYRISVYFTYISNAGSTESAYLRNAMSIALCNMRDSCARYDTLKAKTDEARNFIIWNTKGHGKLVNYYVDGTAVPFKISWTKLFKDYQERTQTR